VTEDRSRAAKDGADVSVDARPWREGGLTYATDAIYSLLHLLLQLLL